MPTWDSAQYLKFGDERTQPAVDLAHRIGLAAPARAIDLGCGPGNSTAVLARRWPGAALSGLDSSDAMIAAARRDFPQWTWSVGDIAGWQGDGQSYDLVFSNAALQWVPDHARLLPRLLDRVAPGGALAVQVPANIDAPAHRLMREIGGSGRWRARFARAPREWHVESAEFYYETLAPQSSRVDLWFTDYLHVMDSSDAIVEWYRGTGLRPWLDALSDTSAREAFLAEYRAEIARAFPARSNGRVLFPFRRFFFVAYR
jgi:trans-aconitate 2-methyltransferase